MKNIFFENLSHLIVRDFWTIKIWSYFHKFIWVAIFFIFQIFVPKTHFLKALHMSLFIWTLWVFFKKNFQMTLATLNTSFHIDWEGL